MRFPQLDKQFSYEFALSPEQLQEPQAHFVHKSANARHRYWGRFFGSIVIYRGKLLCRMDNKELLEEIRWSFPGFLEGDGQWFFEKDNLAILYELLGRHGLTIIHRAPFFAATKSLEQVHVTWDRVFFDAQEILAFDGDGRVENAFSFNKGREKDQLGLGYYEDGNLLAMAGASWVAPNIWELGIDKLVTGDQYQGLASQLIQDFTQHIQSQHPELCLTYSTQFSHISSMNVAIRAGYELAWTELVIDSASLFDGPL